MVIKVLCGAAIVVGALATTSSEPRPPMLVNTCLITDHVAELVDFYEHVLGQTANRTGEDYAEIRTGATVLAIFSAKAQQAYIPGSATPAHNLTIVLEFRVSDVKQPATTPWRTRSFYFRDPDGNLVDFFAPASS